jgi:hypothetical protein
LLRLVAMRQSSFERWKFAVDNQRLPGNARGCGVVYDNQGAFQVPGQDSLNALGGARVA